MDNLAGENIRGYEIKERIGSGGYGIVYRAFQHTLDRDVAIKFILPARAKTEYFVKRFDAEARLVAKLEHPNIVPLYDYWRDEDSAALVMRWLPGGDLCGILKSGPLTIEKTLKLLTQIGDALTLAHKNKVVHRDLKPGNVLLDDGGNFYLTDFGIAKDLKGIITNSSTGGHVTGTPAYLSPEQGMGKKVTHQSDIYSLAVVLYELLTGEHPFPEADPTTQIIHHISDPLPPVSEKRDDLPSALDDVIEIATAKDPEQRYDSIQQLVFAFREAVGFSSEEGLKRVPGILEKKLGIKSYVPAFLTEEELADVPPREIFVGRDRPLAKLDEFFQKALSGKTQIVFVTGEAGRGKTALIQEFARRAESNIENLIVAQGGSSLYTGVADPYLPFRQALAMLTGDVESQLTSGDLSYTQALRLWDLLPDVCKSLVDTSPDLVDTFISGRELASRAAGYDAKGRPWQSQLAHLLSRKAEEGFTAESGQSQLYRQYIKLLRNLSKSRPIIILLDDLHWIDQASLGLLAAIGYELKTSPILFVGAYREEEIQDREASTHPLESVLSEFKRQFGDIWIDLDRSERAEDLAFVDEYLDSEPNRLDKKFRLALSRHTHGHALFLKELLRDLQERGELIKDDQDCWVEKRKDITWDHLPARVEGVIEKRIERLDRDARRVLEVASVEGERFSAEVVANVLERDTSELVDHLSNDLVRRHQLVEDLGVEKLNGNSVSRFRFSHGLLQSYLYNRVTESRRMSTHKNIAKHLERLYTGHTQDIAPLLAKHFELAGDVERSTEYYLQAGDRARLAYANKEAMKHYQAALELVGDTGDFESAARLQMKLAITYQNAFDFKAANQATQKAFSLWKRVGEQTTHQAIPPAPHAFRYLEDELETLDPALSRYPGSAFYIHQIFAGLVDGTMDGDILPDVAHSWEIMENGLKYVFHLRTDMYWSDGVPVTAADFVFAFKRILDPATNAVNADMLTLIKNGRTFLSGDLEDSDLVGVAALDEFTLEIELEEPTSYFLHLLADTVARPVPRHILAEHGEAWTEVDKIVTNGPFYLASLEKGEEKDSIVLERNTAYPGRFPGNLERVEGWIWGGRGSASPDDLQQAYLDGQLDELELHTFAFPPAEVQLLRQRHVDEYVTQPILSSWYFTFVIDQPPFDDNRVRRAFALAFDRDVLVGETLLGLQTPATGGYIPIGIPGHVPEIGLPFDPERARLLLGDAGYPAGHGFPEIEAFFIPSLESTSNYLLSQWREVLGINIKRKIPRNEPESTEMRSSPLFKMHGLGWLADYPDPHNFLRDSFMGIVTQWQNIALNDTFIDLIDQARQTIDQQKRLELYQQADTLLVEDALVVPLFYGRSHRLVKPWVKGNPEFLRELIIEPH